MKIPENFKKKYNLTGESYSPENVEAALSELFAVSSRLYKENADLKAELERLRAEAANAAPAPAPEVDLSGIESKLSELAAKLSSVHTAVNDVLCVANDAAISAKKAEDAAIEAKASSADAKIFAGEARDSADQAYDSIEALSEKIDNIEVNPVIYPSETAVETAAESDIVLNELFASVPEDIITEPVLEAEGGTAIGEGDLAEEDEKVIIEETAILDAFEDEHEKPAAAPFVIGDDLEAPPIVIDEEHDEIEIVEGSTFIKLEDEFEEEPIEVGDIAEDLIRSAGLTGEPEVIEPAEAIADEDVTAKLSDMIAEEPEAEEEPIVIKEAPAPSTFNDMKSALDAIRARLKK